jgi:dATP pyrophosphohydrolase
MPPVVSEIVEVIIFRFARAGTEFLLVERSPHDALYPGLWQVVTGSVRAGETAVDAARREVLEETGLSALEFWVVPYVGSFYDAQHDRLHLTPFFAAEVASGAEVRLSSEHEKYRWVEFAEATGILPWPAQKEALRVLDLAILKTGPTASLSRLR